MSFMNAIGKKTCLEVGSLFESCSKNFVKFSSIFEMLPSGIWGPAPWLVYSVVGPWLVCPAWLVRGWRGRFLLEVAVLSSEMSCPVLSCPVLSCFVLSCPGLVLSCPVVSSRMSSFQQTRSETRAVVGAPEPLPENLRSPLVTHTTPTSKTSCPSSNVRRNSPQSESDWREIPPDI